MTYDDWKTESPEDEDERINGPMRRAAARRRWEEDNADYLLEKQREDKECGCFYDKELDTVENCSRHIPEGFGEFQ